MYYGFQRNLLIALKFLVKTVHNSKIATLSSSLAAFTRNIIDKSLILLNT